MTKVVKKKTKKKTKKSPPRAVAKLTDKDIIFVEEYLTHFQKGKAYLKTNPNVKLSTAYTEGSKRLRKPHVQEYYQKRLAERNLETVVDRQWVVEKYKAVVNANYFDILNKIANGEGGELPEELQILNQGGKITKTEKTFRGGDSEYSETFDLKFMSKDQAATLLGKHVGAFEKDNVKTLHVKGFAEMIAELDVPDDD